MKYLVFITLIALGINLNTGSAQTLQQCADFTNLYCKQYFGNAFPGRQYQRVLVNKTCDISANCMGIFGTVTFLDAFGIPQNNYFLMAITITSSNTMDVKFSKLNQERGSEYWKYCNNAIPIQQQTSQAQAGSYQVESQITSAMIDGIRMLRDQQLINNQMALNDQVPYRPKRAVIYNLKY